MPIQVTATEAKARMLRLLDHAEAGEEVEITRHGRIVARLVPAIGARSLAGCMAGVARTVDPDDELFSTGERWDAF
jgi:prevent-host-death family protein